MFNKLLYLLTFIFLFVACQKNAETDTQKLKIVTTTGMIADLIQNIVGENAEVEALMGAGVDPHLYKATQSDLAKLRQADIIFYNGLHLEGKMAEVLEKFSKRKKIVALGERLPKNLIMQLDENTEVYDPHIWFDVSLWQQVLEIASEELINLDRENTQFYVANTQKYKKKLQVLHQELRENLASIPKKRRVLITAHDAFGYFGKAYNIKVKALQGISTLSEFGLRDISDLVNFIVKQKIKAVFVESSIPKKSLEAVVKGCLERKHQVKIGGMLYSDAMGETDTPTGTYLGMVKANMETIVKSLQ